MESKEVMQESKLDLSLAKLNVKNKSTSTRITSTLLQYSGWRVPPIPSLLSPATLLTDLASTLDTFLVLGIPINELPQIKIKYDLIR
jgi:hypothetical protein